MRNDPGKATGIANADRHGTDNPGTGTDRVDKLGIGTIDGDGAYNLSISITDVNRAKNPGTSTVNAQINQLQIQHMQTKQIDQAQAQQT